MSSFIAYFTTHIERIRKMDKYFSEIMKNLKKYIENIYDQKIFGEYLSLFEQCANFKHKIKVELSLIETTCEILSRSKFEKIEEALILVQPRIENHEKCFKEVLEDANTVYEKFANMEEKLNINFNNPENEIFFSSHHAKEIDFFDTSMSIETFRKETIEILKNCKILLKMFKPMQKF